MNIENAEKNLWDQIRSVTQIQMRVMQGGITILSGYIVAVAFYRKQNSEYLELPKGEPYPLSHWWIGFVILLIIAFVFHKIRLWVSGRLFYYIDALHKLPEEYNENDYRIYPKIPCDTSITKYTTWVFWVFPLFDIIVYCSHWLSYLTHHLLAK